MSHTKQELHNLRRDYSLASLEESDTSQNPIKQFEQWFQEALDAEVLEPNAMVVATIQDGDFPNARVVLLKEVNPDGFVFFTNYDSAKGQELIKHPKAALCFNWLELQRQVRIQGRVRKIEPSESTAYFQSRPKGSQIGAWASPQSTVIPNRDFLENRVESLIAQYADAEELPRPEFWGGFIVEPLKIEFWQGRSSRLHDRIEYQLDAQGNWMKQRLAP